jgi:hypothetical protein
LNGHHRHSKDLLRCKKIQNSVIVLLNIAVVLVNNGVVLVNFDAVLTLPLGFPNISPILLAF